MAPQQTEASARQFLIYSVSWNYCCKGISAMQIDYRTLNLLCGTSLSHTVHLSSQTDA